MRPTEQGLVGVPIYVHPSSLHQEEQMLEHHLVMARAAKDTPSQVLEALGQSCPDHFKNNTLKTQS